MKIGAAILFVLFATVKYMVAPPAGLEAGFGLWGTILGMIIGGIVGVLTFFFTANYFLDRARKKRLKKYAEIKAAGGELPKILTRKNKGIVRLKKRLGLYGIVFIALPFVSLPVEGILCAKFFKHEKKKLIPLLILSVIIWSFLLTFFYNSFYEDLKALF